MDDSYKWMKIGFLLMALGVVLVFVAPCMALIATVALVNSEIELEPAGIYDCKVNPPNEIQGDVELMNDWMEHMCELQVELDDFEASQIIDSFQGPNGDRRTL